MLAIVLCFVGLAYGQYPYPAPYPPAYQAVRGQIQPVQLEAQPVHSTVPIQHQQLIQPVSQPIAQQPIRTIQPVQPIRTIQPVQPIRTIQPVQPIRTVEPLKSKAPYPYAPSGGVQLEGGDLSPVEQDATPEGKYPSPVQTPSLSGGDLSPEQLEIPPNTQVKLQDGQLQYSHGFSDDSGTSVREQGSLLSTNDGWEYVIAKKGSYSYVSPEGKTISVNYIADHNGFRVLPN